MNGKRVAPVPKLYLDLGIPTTPIGRDMGKWIKKYPTMEIISSLPLGRSRARSEEVEGNRILLSQSNSTSTANV